MTTNTLTLSKLPPLPPPMARLYTDKAGMKRWNSDACSGNDTGVYSAAYMQAYALEAIAKQRELDAKAKPAGWQRFDEESQKWVECTYFVAHGFTSMVPLPGFRAVYAHPPRQDAEQAADAARWRDLLKMAMEALSTYQGFIDDAHILEGQWHWLDDAKATIATIDAAREAKEKL